MADLSGRVALVAGATRGAGRAIAVELARSGAFVNATGHSSRVSGPSDMDRPETIEQTGDLMAAAGGRGSALRVDHLDAEAVRAGVDTHIITAAVGPVPPSRHRGRPAGGDD